MTNLSNKLTKDYGIVYKREKWKYIIFLIIITFFATYIGHNWLIWFFFVLAITIENSNRPIRNLRYKLTKEIKND